MFRFEPRREHPIGANRHARRRGLEAHHDLVKMFRFAHGEIFHRAFDHAFDRIAVAVEHPGGKRTVVHPDSNRAAQTSGLLHERRKRFEDLFPTFVKIPFGLLVERRDARIDKVPRVDAHLLDPLESFESRLRLEMDIRRNGNSAARPPNLLHRFFESLRIRKRRNGNANQFAARIRKRNRLRDGSFHIFRLRCRHGLHKHRRASAYHGFAHLYLDSLSTDRGKPVPDIGKIKNFGHAFNIALFESSTFSGIRQAPFPKESGMCQERRRA